MGTGNCKADCDASELGVASTGSRRLESSTRYNGRGIGCISLTASDTLAEKVPFILVRVKWDVSPDNALLVVEGTIFRKLDRSAFVILVPDI